MGSGLVAIKREANGLPRRVYAAQPAAYDLRLFNHSPNNNQGDTMSGGDWKDMYQAAESGDLARVQYHIQGGVDPNYQHPEVQCTPLVASLIQGHAEVTRYLLANGADPHLLSDFDGLTPGQAARKFGRTEFVAQLGTEKDAPRQPFWWRWLPV
jgi:hypothetical protein